MILVFGAVCKDIDLQVHAHPQTSNAIFADEYRLSYGGKGTLQALAAARSGAKVALVGKAGDDGFAENLLRKIRQDGVSTTAVGKSDLATGIRLFITDKDDNKKTMIALGANAEATADQIPDEILDEKAFLLLQTELNAEENLKLLARAKAQNVTTIMNLAPTIDLYRKAFDNLDYLILNQEEARILARKIDLDIENDALKLAEGLSKQGNLNCIVTIGIKGSVAHTTSGDSWRVGAFMGDDIVDRTGAQDAYCGTFAACLHAGMPLPRAMKRASIAGSLTCMKKGSLEALPYLDDIEEHINELGDPIKG